MDELELARCRCRRLLYPLGQAHNLLGDRNLSSSLVFALCNAGEALLAAGLIQYYFGSPFTLDRLRHVLGLLGAAIVATAVSGVRTGSHPTRWALSRSRRW